MLRHYAPLIERSMLDLEYYEPFAGSAALFNHLSDHSQTSGWISDINKELMDLYRLIQSDPDYLNTKMHEKEAKWLSLSTPDRKLHYYELRSRYWGMPFGTEATALLYFLMRTGFNGIWQTCKSSNGRYGTPAGLAAEKKRVFCPDTVNTWANKLTHMNIRSGCYKDLIVDDRSFVFCDPPYRDSFANYGTDFNDKAQMDLIKWCRDVHARTGSIVWLSNRDNPDKFFKIHAPDATLHKFPVIYTAGRRRKTADGYQATPATEILLTWQ